MTSITGLTAPLHRRFDEQDALRQIKSRYTALHEDIESQIRLLQSDPRFLARCEDYYHKGYKDWHILSAILNQMLQIRQCELGNQLRTKQEFEEFKKMALQLKGRVYPVERFLTSELDFMFVTHALTCLHRMGFEERAGLDQECTRKFLRERMRHFDLDIPHQPMFRSPPGVWPI
jgi:hypothetical protein